MTKRRGLLLGVAGLALAATSVAATVYAMYFRLPDPATTDVRGLFRWLATRDLATESVETRRVFVTRFEAEMQKGLKVSESTGNIDPQYREQIDRNVDTLLEEWFHLHAEEFAALPERERFIELNRQLDQMEKWGLADRIAAGPQTHDQKADRQKSGGQISSDSKTGAAQATLSKSTSSESTSSESMPRQATTRPSKPASGLDAFNQLSHKLETWIDRAAPEAQPTLRDFAAALKGQIAARAVKSMFDKFLAPPAR